MEERLSSLRVAIATGNGQRVDQHFARSPIFDIYNVENNGFSFIERRENTAARCGCEGGDRATSFEEIFDIINDCRFVVAFRIGSGAISHLVDRGIMAAQIDDTVENALAQLIESGKFKIALRRQG